MFCLYSLHKSMLHTDYFFKKGKISNARNIFETHLREMYVFTTDFFGFNFILN